MAEYKTHTDPPLLLRWQGGDNHRVTLEGENVKVLYEGNSMGEARKVFEGVKSHYEERQKTEQVKGPIRGRH